MFILQLFNVESMENILAKIREWWKEKCEHWALKKESQGWQKYEIIETNSKDKFEKKK